MKKKNSAGLTKNIIKIVMIIPALFSLAANLMSHARFEVLLMRKQMIMLFLLSLMFFVLLLSVWISGMGVLLVYLHTLNVSLMLMVSMVFVLNLLLLIIVTLLMLRLKVDPSFPETRKVIEELINT